MYLYNLFICTMTAKSKKTGKSSVEKVFWWENKKKINEFWKKKLTMRDFFWFWSNNNENNQVIEDKTAINNENNWITMTIIDDSNIINHWIYTINDEQVQKFFQFIKEKAFYQQLWPQIVMNKFKEIIWYDK